MDLEKYDLAVIGGGAAGAVAAVSAGAFGAKVVLLEKTGRYGGECSWTGCVPSKALISYADNVYRFNRKFAGKSSFKMIGLQDNKNVFKYVRETTESASRFSKIEELLLRYGVKTYFTSAKLLDNHHLKIGRKEIFAKKMILCTGSLPIVPDIKGMEEGYYLTNREIWELEELPESMMIIGGGNIGLEIAQSLNRLGTKVHVFDLADRLLPNDDGELGSELLAILEDEKIRFTLGVRINLVKLREDSCTIWVGEKNQKFSAEKVLMAIGRKPDIEGLDLEEAGVEYNNKGIKVDNRLKTTASNIYAAGDCNGINQFSHIAEVEAKIAVRNALFPFSSKVDYQGTPWTTFTDPELSHFGLTEEECKEKEIKYRVFRHSFSGDERALVDGRTEGKVKILATASGKILGAHILGHRSGELINEFVLARKKSARIYDIGMTSHVYPTLGMSLQRATDQWFADIVRQTWVRRLLKIFINK